MKKITLLILSIFFSISYGQTCSHTLVMYDAYDDTWNGASVDIVVNNNVVVNTTGPANGVTGDTLEFDAASGDTITLENWVSGDWDNEISWEILDGAGVIIESGSFGGSANATAYCTPPPPCSHTLVMYDAYDDTWNGASVDIVVNNNVVVNTTGPANGVTGDTLEFDAASGDTITLENWVSGDWDNEISWEILDGAGVIIESGSFGGSANATANCPSCLPPSDLAVSSITTTSAIVSWTAGGSETLWNIEVVDISAGNTVTGTATHSGVTDNPFSLTGLTSGGNHYEVYIQADCGSGIASAWAGPVSFTSLCEAISSFPWTEDFESVTAPALPSCFSELNNNSDTDYWNTYSGYGNSGSNAVGLYTDFNGGSNDDYLILPQFTLTGSERLLYNVRARSANEPNDYKVVLSTTGNSAADFTIDLLDLTTVSSTTYEEQIIDLSAYSGDIYIAIHVPSGGLDGWYIYFDDFTVEVPSVDTMDWNNLQWVQPTADASSGSTTLVTVEVGTQISAYSQGYKAGLTDTTTGSAAAGVECWIGIHNEDTDPSTWPSSAWNIATFDSDQGNNDEYLLTTTNAPIGTNYVASRWRVNSGLYTYGGYNGPWDGLTNTSVELVVTPVAGDTFGTATDLPFTISPEGAGCVSHNLSVDFSTSGPGYTASGLSSQGTTGPGYDAFFNWTATTDGLRWWGNGTGNPYISILDSSGNEIDYSTYGQSDVVLQGWSVGDELVIRIFDYGTSQVHVQFCLELFSLPQAPNCAENLAPTGTDIPFNNGAVTISWDAPTTGPAPTDYEVFWGTESGNLSSIGLVGDPTMTSVNITGLEYGGTYYFSVVPQNGGTLASGCSEASFTVENASIPFNCDFENFPAGFTEASGAYGSPTGTISTWGTADFLNDATLQKGAKVNIWSTSTDEYLISPSFDLSSGTHFLNVKAGITDYNSSSADPVGMDPGDDYVSILQSEDDGSTWTELYRWDSNSGLINESSSISEITLSSTSSTVKFAFYAFSGVSGGDYDFHITDFRITSTSLGIEDSSISLFNYFPNPVNDMLTIRAQKDVDHITVYNMLGQVVKRQSPNTRDCTVDLSAMQTGAYFVKVSIDNTVETVRILKN